MILLITELMIGVGLRNSCVVVHVYRESKKKSEGELWLDSSILCKFVRLLFTEFTDINTGTGQGDSGNTWKVRSPAV